MSRNSEKKSFARNDNKPAAATNREMKEELSFLRQKFSSLSLRGHYKECFKLIEDNLPLLYFKDRWPENFYSSLRIHKKCYPSMDISQTYDQYLDTLLKKNNIPAIFVKMLRNPDPNMSWTSEYFKEQSVLAKEAKEFNDALDYSELMIKLDPANSNGYLLKGWLLEDLGMDSQAAEAFEQSIEINEKNYQAYRSLASHFRVSNPQKALEYINKAISSSPDEPTFFSTKSDILRQLKDLKGAIENIERAHSLDPLNPEHLYKKGEILLEDNQRLNALRHYTQALALDSRHIPSHTRLLNLFAADQPELALPSANTLVTMLPDNKEVSLLRAKLLYRTGNNPDAVKQFQAVLAVDQNCAEAFGGLGEIYLVESPQRALQTFTSAVALDPNNPSYHLGRGRSLQKLSQNDEAIIEFKATIGIDKQNATALGQLGTLYAETQPAIAIGYLNKAISLIPTNPYYQQMKGEALMRLPNKLADAIDCFNKAVLLDPGNANLQLRMAQLLEESGKLASAAEHYSTAANIDPSLIDAHKGLGRLLVEKEPNTALIHINHALRLDYTSAVLYYLKALALIGLSSKYALLVPLEEEILSQLNSSLEQGSLQLKNDLNQLDASSQTINPIDFLREKSNLMDVIRRTEQVAHLLLINDNNAPAEFKRLLSDFQARRMNQVSQRCEDFFEPLDEVRGLMSGGVTRVALMYINRAVELSPQNSEFVSTRADLHLQGGAIAKALEQYEYAVKLNEQNHRGWYGIGQIFALKKDKKALEMFDKAISLNPEIAQYHIAKADFLTEFPASYSQALAAYDCALKLDNQQWEVLQKKAQLLKSHGDIPGAISHFRRALLIHPDSLIANVNMGLLLENINTTAALAYLDHAIGLYGEDPHHCAIKARILYSLDQIEAGDAAAQKVLLSFPSEDEGCYLLAQAFADDLPQIALPYINHAVTLADDKAEYNMLLGDVLDKLSRYDEAASYYRKTAALDPFAHLATARLASVLFDMGDASCLQAIETALSKDSFNPQYLFIKAIILSSMAGNPLGAIDCLFAALETDPDNVDIREKLVELLEANKGGLKLLFEKQKLSKLRKKLEKQHSDAVEAAKNAPPPPPSVIEVLSDEKKPQPPLAENFDDDLASTQNNS